MSIIYDNSVINISREELITSLQSRLSPKRFEHVLRVESTAIQMANDFGVDPVRASIAALLHDYCKEIPAEDMYELARNFTPIVEEHDANPHIWHSYAAAYVARETFNIQDVEIMQAIACHTIGGETMEHLSQIIFIADYIEPGRDFKGVDKVRKLVKEDLEEAVLTKMKQTIQHLVKKEEVIFPVSVKIYNEWIKKKRG